MNAYGLVLSGVLLGAILVVVRVVTVETARWVRRRRERARDAAPLPTFDVGRPSLDGAEDDR